MIRLAIGLSCILFAVVLWHIGDVDSLGVAWLCLLAWAGGGLTALVVLDWLNSAHNQVDNG